MKKVVFITAFFVLGILACERPDSTINNSLIPPDKASISIADAKNYFINKVLPLTASARQATSQKYERDIDWDSAKKVKQANGLEVVAAPVKYKTNGRPGVIIWDDKASDEEKKARIENVLNAKECLLTYKDKSGNIQTQLVQYISSKDYKTKKGGSEAV